MEIDRKFIADNIDEHPDRLRLRFLGKRNLKEAERKTLSDSILQIECQKKYNKKFPGFIQSFPDFIFPSTLAGEQASHLWVAKLHAAIASRLKETSAFSSPSRYACVDMTAGLGIDFIAISSKLTEEGAGAIAIEHDYLKAEVLRFNLDYVGLPLAVVKCDDSIKTVDSLACGSVFLIFADPARRGEGNSRIYDPKDCSPDITGHWNLLLSKAEWIMVKNSPLLDLRKALEIFPGTSRLVVVSVRNECKEVLVIARKDATFEGVECVNVRDFTDDNVLVANVTFVTADEWNIERLDIAEASISDVKEGYYLYEPNSSVMKASPWRALISRYPSLLKLSPNCHLFISENLIPDFPGRIHRILSIPEKSERKSLKGDSFNVVTRNYPQSPDELTKNLKIKTGGERFLYGAAVSSSETPILIITDMVSTHV